MEPRIAAIKREIIEACEGTKREPLARLIVEALDDMQAQIATLDQQINGIITRMNTGRIR